MLCSYRLDIASTGKSIAKGKANVCALSWKTRTCKKLLKRKKLAEYIKKAIEEDDLVVAWADFDQLVRNGTSVEELIERSKFMWKGME